jgi:hypothetical protein
MVLLRLSRPKLILLTPVATDQNTVEQLLIDELAGVAWRFDITKLAVADRYDA